MKRIIFVFLLSVIMCINSHAQTMRMVMGIAGGKSHTLGQSVVGFSNGSPNKLWQGFWIPKGITTSVFEKAPIMDQPQSISKVYPNPASSFVSFESSEPIASIEIIHGMTGQNMYNGIDPYIDLNNFAPTVYIIKITHTNGVINVHKLIVTR